MSHGKLSTEEREAIEEALRGLVAMPPRAAARAAGYLATVGGLMGAHDADFTEVAQWVGRILEVVGHRKDKGVR